MASTSHHLVHTGRSFSWRQALWIILPVAALGAVIVWTIFAAGTPIAFEAESGTVKSPATTVAASGASGGSAVRFATAATSSPTPTSTPVSSGWPTTATTGWQHTGVTLGAYRGDITISTNGTVLDGQDLGCVTVQANNVTISRSRILCDGGYWGVKQVSGYTGFTLTDTEIARPAGSTNNVDDLVSIMGGTANLLRNNVHNGSTGFQIAASNVTVQDNYVWDQKNTSGQDHVDALLDNGGTSNVTIRHNAFEVNLNQTSALALYDDSYTGGAEHTTIVDNNLLNGGGYCIYPGGSSSSGVQVTNNHFGRKFYTNCGYYGTDDSDLWSKSGVWSGNVWDDTGQAISAP